MNTRVCVCVCLHGRTTHQKRPSNKLIVFEIYSRHACMDAAVYARGVAAVPDCLLLHLAYAEHEEGRCVLAFGVFVFINACFGFVYVVYCVKD